MTTAEEVFGALGTHRFASVLATYLSADVDAMEALWARYAGLRSLPTQPAWQDVTTALTEAGRRWPERFVELVRENPMPHGFPLAVNVLGAIDTPAARDLLVELSGTSEHALGVFLTTDDPRVTELLPRAIGGANRELVLLVALDLGDKRLLGRLRRIAGAARTGPRHRELALDAIAAISARAGLPSEPDRPGWRRLVDVPRPDGPVTVAVRRHQLVRAGTPLTTEPGVVVTAPCDGLIETVSATRPVLARIRPCPWTAEALVRELHRAAGDPYRFDALLEGLTQFGEDGCDAAFLHYGEDVGPTEGHGVDIFENVSLLVRTAARHWPDRFLHNVRNWAGSPLDSEIIRGLSEVDRQEARDLLVAAVKADRSTEALWSLAALGDPRLPYLLVELVRARSSSLRAAAFRVALDFGDERLLPALRRHPDDEAALDAIEAINLRTGRMEVAPEQRRLVAVTGPAGAAVIGLHAYRYDWVQADQELVELRVDARTLTVVAPVAGNVVTVGARVGRPAPPVLVRIRPVIGSTGGQVR